MSGEEMACAASGRPREHEVAGFANKVLTVVLVLIELLLILSLAVLLRQGFRERLEGSEPESAVWFLMSWFGFLYSHALAFAWFRLANGGRAGLLGFIGLLCMLAVGGTLPVLAPSLGPWSFQASHLLRILGILLLFGAFASLGRELRMHPRPTEVEMEAGFSISRWAFAGAVFLTLVIVVPLGVLVMIMLSLRVLTDEPHWSMSTYHSYLPLYWVGLYLVVSLIVLVAAAGVGLRAIRKRDRERLWQAGVLAMVGGLQHAVLVVLPAVVVGILALRAVKRTSKVPVRTLWGDIGRSWGIRKGPGVLMWVVLSVIAIMFLLQILAMDEEFLLGSSVVMPLLALIYAIASGRIRKSIFVPALCGCALLLGWWVVTIVSLEHEWHADEAGFVTGWTVISCVVGLAYSDDCYSVTHN